MGGGAGAIKFLLVVEVKGGGANFECFDDVIGDGIEELNHVTGDEHALAEGVKAFNFTAALLGGVGFVAGASGQAASDERGGEEGEEGHPVLGIRDGEGANGRQEKVIEGEHGGHGHEGGHGKSPKDRNC